MSEIQRQHQHSVCNGWYPPVRWQENRRWLYNPYTRKRLADRPEERVRLQLAAFLVHAGIPASRLIFESAVSGTSKKGMLRTDLLITDAAFKPVMLIECKAPQIPLSIETARQALIYNQRIGAPLLMLTNGVQDVYYENGHFSENRPDMLQQSASPLRDDGYWIDTGFLSPQLTNHARTLLTRSLNARQPEAGSIVEPGTDAPMPHYVVYDGQPGDAWMTAAWTDAFNRQRITLERIKNRQSAGVLDVQLHPDGTPEQIRIETADGWTLLPPAVSAGITAESLLSWENAARFSTFNSIMSDV